MLSCFEEDSVHAEAQRGHSLIAAQSTACARAKSVRFEPVENPLLDCVLDKLELRSKRTGETMCNLSASLRLCVNK